VLIRKSSTRHYRRRVEVEKKKKEGKKELKRVADLLLYKKEGKLARKGGRK
jgi:hypothetical protein